MRKILLIALVFAAIPGVAIQAQESRVERRILFLTHSAGYVHDVVKRPSPDQLSFAEAELTKIAAERGYPVDCTQDCSVLNGDNLRKYAVVAFCTTGELPAHGGAEALLTWVRHGGGFVGIHCAADTWYTVPAYGDMLGGVFDGHPWNQKVTVKQQDFASYQITDEIYQFKNCPPEPLRVELSLDVGSVDASKGKHKDGDYPLCWTREYGNGRVFYLALGHGESAWNDQHFRKLLRKGLTYAATYLDISVAFPPVDSHTLFSAPSPTVAFVQRDGSPCRWSLAESEMTVAPKSTDIISTEKFADFRLHLEFRVPAHGNSGVFLADSYEIRILDSYGLEPKADGCGAILGKKAPMTNACRKPGEWQSFDVGFKAARFDASGKKTANARVSAWQNGLRIQDDVEIHGPTAGGVPETPESRPIRLQDGGSPVSFRNIWVVPR